MIDDRQQPLIEQTYADRPQRDWSLKFVSQVGYDGVSPRRHLNLSQPEIHPLMTLQPTEIDGLREAGMIALQVRRRVTTC